MSVLRYLWARSIGAIIARRVVEPEETAEYIRIETVPGKYTLVDFPNVLWMGVTEFADLYQDSVVGSTRKEAVAWANVQVEKRRQAYVEATGRAL